jgi:hypothetical protein
MKTFCMAYYESCLFNVKLQRKRSMLISPFPPSSKADFQSNTNAYFIPIKGWLLPPLPSGLGRRLQHLVRGVGGGHREPLPKNGITQLERFFCRLCLRNSTTDDFGAFLRWILLSFHIVGEKNSGLLALRFMSGSTSNPHPSKQSHSPQRTVISLAAT